MSFISHKNKAIAVGAVVWLTPAFLLLFFLIQINQNKKINSLERSEANWGEAKLIIQMNQKNDLDNKAFEVNETNIQVLKNNLKEDKLWIVQIASFSQKKLADLMLETLQKNGYSAMIYEQKRTGNTIYAVRLKPLSTRTEADIKQKEIQMNFDYSPTVFSYSH